MIEVEILENPADIVNAIKQGYMVEKVANGRMWLSRPSAEQKEREKKGEYFERRQDY